MIDRGDAPGDLRGLLADLTVLLVEDDCDGRDAFTILLSSYGARVASVGSAGEALEAFDRGRFDVIVSDIGLPDEDGFALIEEVRAREFDGGRIPAIAMTAFGAGAERERALKAGFEAFVTKPVGGDTLAILIATLAPRRAVVRELAATLGRRMERNRSLRADMARLAGENRRLVAEGRLLRAESRRRRHMRARDGAARRAARVSGHDIVVVGASAGGVRALRELLGGLPSDFGAAVFVVQHLSATRLSNLDAVLAFRSQLPVKFAVDGDTFAPGTVYVAPPDRHLIVERGFVRVVRGPKENRFRPSVDVLFRSAAVAYGPRVVGVVLTGSLADGAAGLVAVKRRGGVAVVQEPKSAQFPSMPTSAARAVTVDASVPLEQIAPLLVRLAASPAPMEGEFPVPDDMELEAQIARQDLDTAELLARVERIGTRTPFTCPECHGTLWQMNDAEVLRFRCHVGHAFGADSLVSAQTETVEAALWSAARALEERVTLAGEIARRSAEAGDVLAAERFAEEARRLDEHVAVVRGIVLGTVTVPQHSDGAIAHARPEQPEPAPSARED